MEGTFYCVLGFDCVPNHVPFFKRNPVVDGKSLSFPKTGGPHARGEIEGMFPGLIFLLLRTVATQSPKPGLQRE